MAPQDLATDLQEMHIGKVCVPFNPPGDDVTVETMFNKIPRYLFRVSSPDCVCTTNYEQVKSHAAWMGSVDSQLDCFENPEKVQVAKELNSHLRWWTCNESNFVSWTSSLLFAAQYICYKIANGKDFHSSLDTIELYVVDTKHLRERAFIQDLDLMQFFSSWDTGEKGLDSFRLLRARQHAQCAGSYYFGEYLSQGSLTVNGNITMLSARALVDAGLPILRPELNFFRAKAHNDPENKWADTVIRLRQDFYDGQTRPVSQAESDAVMAVTQPLDICWRLPIAANLLALLPRDRSDKKLRGIASKLGCTDEERGECSRERTKIHCVNTLPEVEEYARLMSLWYTDHCFDKAGEALLKAQDILQDIKEDPFSSSRNMKDKRDSALDHLAELYGCVNEMRTITKSLS